MTVTWYGTPTGIQIGEELESNREKITNIRSKVRLTPVALCGGCLCGGGWSTL